MNASQLRLDLTVSFYKFKFSLVLHNLHRQGLNHSYAFRPVNFAKRVGFGESAEKTKTHNCQGQQ